MTIKEFRNLILQTQNPTWFNTKEIELNFTTISYHGKFTGLPSLYSFLIDQREKYQKLELIHNSALTSSVKFFITATSIIERFLNDRQDIPASNSLDVYFAQILTGFDQAGIASILTADSSEAKLVADLEKLNPITANSAYKYLTKSTESNFNSFDALDGYLIAYEFKMREHRIFKGLIGNDKKSINLLKNELSKAIPESEHNLNEHLIKTEATVKEYFDQVETYKIDKEKLFEDWFINSKGKFENFDKSCNSRLTELEETYNQKLKLEEPAKYWEERGKDLKRQGNWSLYAILFIVGLTIGSLAYILIHTPQQLYSSFFDEDKSAAVRWSIIYITILSLIAFVIKQLSKVMFSSFHLARDCQERYTLTYFYLSLLKASAIAPEQQQLIMQSLFSRAESGLLKDDSSPTMPTDIVQNFYKGKN
jgi:hypothetical protein